MPDHYDAIARLRIELAGTDPLVWRRADVPLDLRLRRVHQVIQALFDWHGSHLHQFEATGRIYGLPEIMGDDVAGQRPYSDKNAKLGTVLSRGADSFVYTYDFGDNWDHQVVVEKIFEPEHGMEYPLLVDGARQAPPEDVGGPPGFAAFLAVMMDDRHPDHQELIEWYGGIFDAKDMQLEKVEAMLARIRRSRRKGPAKGSRMTTDKVWQQIG